jgi:hypothetical protein
MLPILRSTTGSARERVGHSHEVCLNMYLNTGWIGRTLHMFLVMTTLFLMLPPGNAGVLHYGDRGPRDRDTDRWQLGACDRIVQRKRQSPSPSYD